MNKVMNNQVKLYQYLSLGEQIILILQILHPYQAIDNQSRQIELTLKLKIITLLIKLLGYTLFAFTILTRPMSSPLKTSSQRAMLPPDSANKNQLATFFLGNQIDQNTVVKDQSKKTIYLPGYLRIKLKNFVKMDLKNLDIELNITIIFTIKYGNKQGSLVDSSVIKELETNLVFLFEKDEGMAVKQVEDQQRNLQVVIKNDQKARQMKYTIRRKINAKVYPDVFWTPFQIINSIITISVQPIKVNNQTIQFNLMDHPNTFLKLSYDTADAFGNYSLAWNRMRTTYTKQRINSVRYFYEQQKMRQIQHYQREQQLARQQDYIQELKYKPFKTDIQVAFIQKYDKQVKQKQLNTGIQLTYEADRRFSQKDRNRDQESNNDELYNRDGLRKFQPYKFANFLIPIYKFPSVQVLTIFLPLVLLSIINLGIFFQDYDLHDRIASISVLLIAFVALIPTLRQSLPPTTEIVLIQYLVYFQTYTSVIALAHSLNVMVDKISLIQQWKNQGNSPNNFPRYDLSLNNSQFLVALVITCLVNFIIIVLVIIHKVVWEPSYNIKPLLIEEKEQFVPESWGHQQCRKDIQLLKRTKIQKDQ